MGSGDHIDTDCLAQENPAAYWAAVDSIHEHASDYGGSERKLNVAEREIDKEAIEEGHRFHVNEEKLKACIEKQDTTPEKLSMALADRLGVMTTPTVFVNGARFVGSVPIEFVFDMVDNRTQIPGTGAASSYRKRAGYVRREVRKESKLPMPYLARPSS